MSKNINKKHFYQLPSGVAVHPCRLIQRDGTLMWNHALLQNQKLSLPTDLAQEQHIIKTAQRLEELNSWVSQGLEPWEGLEIVAWFCPDIDELAHGWSVYFKHQRYDNEVIHNKLLLHIQEHERLELRDNYLYFCRC